MHKHSRVTGSLSLLVYFSFYGVILAAGDESLLGKENPLTPRAYFRRYWKKQVNNGIPEPGFLLAKCSPMNAVESGTYAKLASQNALSSKLKPFCISANLLCFPQLSQTSETHNNDAQFSNYANRNFSNFGTRRVGGSDSFQNYSLGQNLPLDRFQRYTRDATGHSEGFETYGKDGNVVDQAFSSYSAGSTGGAGRFDSYNEEVNVPNLVFRSYSSDANGRTNSFNKYTDKTNSGQQSFTSYRRNANGVSDKFTNYAADSNVMASSFSNYAEKANGGGTAFVFYGKNGNVPENKFRNYAADENAGTVGFSRYRDQSNVGDDSFQSYLKGSNSVRANFSFYGNSFNPGSTKFDSYAQGAEGQSATFRSYIDSNTSFTHYAKSGISFINTSSASMALSRSTWIQPGKFFRESSLTKGNVMPMPDITDKFPARSFLPRTIASKLPFSTSKLDELKCLFHATEGSSMEKMISDAVHDCERAPSPAETKSCAASAEDMVDFAVSVLGRNVVLRTTDNVNGSGRDIMIGTVKGINGGNVTKSVSCHQSLYPYLLYYCHSVPKVRVYEADLLDPKSGSNINHGVAVCHLDTSSWSPTHGAFLALGPGPGTIEVCHWIFENDVSWTVAN